MRDRKFAEPELVRSELVIALSSAIGTDTSRVIEEIKKQLKDFSYEANEIKISRMVLEPLLTTEQKQTPAMRANTMMDLGNELRTQSQDGAILASAAISEIARFRRGKSKDISDPQQLQKTAFIISNLKHPNEVARLRETYGNIFFLVAVNEKKETRLDHLNRQKNLGHDDAVKLVDRDEGESDRLGQHTRDVFELADIHLSLNNPGAQSDNDYLKAQISRMLDLMFGNPFITPTFDEYAMFIAYASSLRSADLGRQVGAAIANRFDEIIATGANDVPRFGGGQYWPNAITFKDDSNGRDYMRSYFDEKTQTEVQGYDANKQEHIRIIEEIINMFKDDTTPTEARWKEEFRNKLLGSSIKYLTEYTRAVHAEMAAILACSRSGISLQDGTLYCSTFPCHNCAKHIVHAGLRRVVYIEPYPKSKTLKLYDDSVTITGEKEKVLFEEFVGIGPRRFFDFFSLQLGSGRCIMRKWEDEGGPVDGSASRWDRGKARLRFQAMALTYIEKETVETAKWESNFHASHNKEFEEEQSNEHPN